MANNFTQDGSGIHLTDNQNDIIHFQAIGQHANLGDTNFV